MIQFTPEFKQKANEWICNMFHTVHHEKYNECVGDSGYGPYWEQGIKCNKCGRRWADPEVEARRHREWCEEQSRQYHCKFGTTDHQLMSFGGKWQDLEWFHEQYECVRKVLSEHRHLDKDIGDIKDKYFVFVDDCQQLDPPVINPYFPDMPWTDEWNLLSNWPGLRQPMTPEALAAWNRRKLNYEQAVEKIKTTVRDERYLKEFK
jgi:hypothetical protein